MEYVHETEMMVRDYECDIQGIVNNAVYQNYLEHASHEFLHDVGLNFSQLCAEGIDAVVTRIEMDYKLSLKPRDSFIVKLGMHKQGRIRFVFDQAIFRQADGKLVLEAEVTGVLTRDGRPIAPDPFDAVFAAKGWDFAAE
jgi:acyl-CoA thioester hydrolase